MGSYVTRHSEHSDPSPNMAMADDGSGYKAKVVIIGDGAIGKTCLLKRMTTDIDATWESFGENYEATTFGQQQLKWEDPETGEEFHIELWDTAGQEALESLRSMSYPGTDVMIIGYNCTDPGSLQNIEYTWVPEFSPQVSPDGLYMIIAGTKVDMREGMDTDKVVPAAAGQDKAVSLKACNWVETSAKTNEGVSDLQNMIMQAIKQKADGDSAKNHVYEKPGSEAAAPAPRASVTGVKAKGEIKSVDSDYAKKLTEHETKPKSKEPVKAPPAAKGEADVPKEETKGDAPCCLVQ